VAVDQQVEVELLRPLLARPLRRDVVGGQLEGDLLTGQQPDGDPARHLPDDLPAGEFRVERRERLDVGGVEGDQFEAGSGSHGRDGASELRRFRGNPSSLVSEARRRSRKARSASLPVSAIAAS
jgi:hypothetical protein